MHAWNKTWHYTPITLLKVKAKYKLSLSFKLFIDNCILESPQILLILGISSHKYQQNFHTDYALTLQKGTILLGLIHAR